MSDNCPCEAVRELKTIVERHDRQLNKDHTEFAEIQKDLQYIKESLDKKSRLNMTTVTAVIQALCTLAVMIIAAKLGV
ncbi:MAG: hypothetical protein E7573_07490 [Ruminococcaceae bacterium]|nr:hypothetical protein [Oscillospiraceae bacterium]MBR3598088.1 hypothetical protein [Clostridia bacterium]